MGDNPYHNQHIQEYARCMDETVFELQQHYDSILLQLQKELKALNDRIMALEKKDDQMPCQVELQVTKASLKKLRDSIMGAFRK